MLNFQENEFELSNNSKYQLRSNKTMLKLRKPIINALKRRFSYRGAKLWNNLPHLKDNMSTYVFKNHINNRSLTVVV